MNGGADDTITPTAATVATALGLPLSERLASDADKRPMFEHRLVEESGILLSHQTIGEFHDFERPTNLCQISIVDPFKSSTLIVVIVVSRSTN